MPSEWEWRRGESMNGLNGKLALYTFGMFIKPSEHPANEGFHRRNDPILEAVEKADGFLARSGYEGDPGPSSWGEQIYPRFYEERGDGWSPATLSLWRDLESPMAFSYFGLHAEALAHGRKWFSSGDWPPLVMWWVEDHHVPDWAEAVDRHETLHDYGATARGFTFRKPFDKTGEETVVDSKRVKLLARAC